MIDSLTQSGAECQLLVSIHPLAFRLLSNRNLAHDGDGDNNGGLIG